MSLATTFHVFGDPVEVLVSSEATHGGFTVVTQTCQPGGGPPPHLHLNEDEAFTPLEGEFELFNGDVWLPLRRGEVRHSLRGNLHTFRNCGATPGKLLIFVTPGGIDSYLRAISPLVMPRDLPQLLEISRPHGILFPGLDPSLLGQLASAGAAS